MHQTLPGLLAQKQQKNSITMHHIRAHQHRRTKVRDKKPPRNQLKKNTKIDQLFLQSRHPPRFNRLIKFTFGERIRNTTNGSTAEFCTFWVFCFVKAIRNSEVATIYRCHNDDVAPAKLFSPSISSRAARPRSCVSSLIRDMTHSIACRPYKKGKYEKKIGGPN